MLNYRVAYRLQMGAFFAEVLDFPEATAFGSTVTEARHNLVSAPPRTTGWRSRPAADRTGPAGAQRAGGEPGASAPGSP
jgi:hypothetical protein